MNTVITDDDDEPRMVRHRCGDSDCRAYYGCDGYGVACEGCGEVICPEELDGGLCGRCVKLSD